MAHRERMLYAPMSPATILPIPAICTRLPQLWKKHGAHGAVGVSDEEPGFAYWFVAHASAPAFSQTLFDIEMWRVSLLLKNENKDLPAPVTQILNAQKP
jgi:thiosulfate dehydrogenase